MAAEVDYKWIGYVFATFSLVFWSSEDFWLIILLLVSVFTYKNLDSTPEKVHHHVARPAKQYVTPKTPAEARREEALRLKNAPVSKQEATPVPTPVVEEKKEVPKEVVQQEVKQEAPKEESKAEPTEVSDAPVVQEEKKVEAVVQEVKEAEEVKQEVVEEKPATQETDVEKPQETVVASDPAEGVVADGAEERRLSLEESTAETDALYKKHRAEADEHAQLRTKYFEEAAEAHKAGDGKKAKELSEMGKEQTKLMEEAGLRAANAIFEGKNLKQPKGTIDLHGLQVKEAEMIVAREVEKAKTEGLAELKVIIGAGHHSDAKGPKVGPAIKKMLTEDGKSFRDDETNASGGAIVVTL